MLFKQPSSAQIEDKRTLTLLVLRVAGGKAAVIAGFGGNSNDSLESGKPLSREVISEGAKAWLILSRIRDNFLFHFKDERLCGMNGWCH